MWVSPGGSGGGLSVWRLLGISAYHLILLVAGYAWLQHRGTPTTEHSKHRARLAKFDRRASTASTASDEDEADVLRTDRGVSRDLCGLMSALLDYHTNTMALAAVLSLSVVFSVVLPWYGMNNAF
jgi:hypothetical protein